jgi:ABC-type nitrate/sulfonate/bicarbonate transport system substrate-binding protein
MLFSLLSIVVGMGCVNPAVDPVDQAAAPVANVAEPLKIGIAIPSWVHGVAWIGVDQGLFAARDLEPEVFVMKGSSATMRGLMSGSIDVGLAGGDAALKANQAGGDLVVIAGLVNKHYHRLIGAKDVDAPSKLRGKVIGLPFFGGPQDMAARVALAGVGLDADKDVSLKAMGAEYARLTALVRGDVAAVTVAAPDSLIAAQGLHVLVDLPALDLPFPYMQLVVRRSVLDAEPAKVDRTLHALCDAIEFYRSHPDESLVHLADELGDKKGPAREAYDAMGPTHLSWPPVPNTEALTAVVEFLAQDDEAYVGVNAAEIVDLGPLGRVQAKGGCGGPPHS